MNNVAEMPDCLIHREEKGMEWELMIDWIEI
jgi:hypothetical protein